MLNFKYLKKGEAQVIIDNLNGGKIQHNCICLNNTDTVLLRTNGSVIYGEYKDGDHRVKFTHNSQYTLPYIATTDYAKYKDVVLAEWKKAYTPEAKAKMQEVRVLIANVMKNKEQQEPIINNETKIEEKKEVKIMNTMTLAHTIRRELGLEGHYHVQLKIAMQYAWAIKRGETTLDMLLNNTEIEQATAPTYNVANKEVAVTVEEPKQEVKKVTVTTGITVYLDKLEGGYAHFNKYANGMTGTFFKYKARNVKDMDKQFARDYIGKVLNILPNDSVIYYYGDYTQMTYLNNEAMRNLADSKNIRFEQGLYGVAPSGIA